MRHWPASSLTVPCVSNVKAFGLSVLSAFTSGWIIRSQSVSLSQVTVSAVSGWQAAWSFPEVGRLLFGASGGNRSDNTKWGVSCHSHLVIFAEKVSWGSQLTLWNEMKLLFPTQIRISGECRQPETSHRCICNPPVCLFDTCRLWLYQKKQLIRKWTTYYMELKSHKGKETYELRVLMNNAAVDCKSSLP